MPHSDLPHLGLTQSVRGRLSLVIGLSMLPVLMFCLAAAAREFVDRRASIAQDLQLIAEAASSEAERVFENAFQILAIAGAQQHVLENIHPECTEFLKSALAARAAFSNFASIAQDGTVLCSAEPVPANTNFLERDWFQDVQASGELVIARMPVGDGAVSQMLVAALPITKPSGANTGTIAVTIRAGFLDRFLRLAAKPEDTTYFLFNASGDLLLGEEDAKRLPSPETLGELIAAKEVVRKARADGGGAYIYAVTELSEGSIYAVFARPELKASLPILMELALDVALPVLLTAIALLIVWLATDRMALRWIRHLRAVSIAHRRGMTGVRAREYESAPLELRELGDAFNTMADAIEKRQVNLVSTLNEREMLLKEIHHRVKNNLQIIISLFNLLARNAKTDRERMLLRDMQARVESLALVHHAAYQAEDLQLIEMRDFLCNLFVYVQRLLEQDDKEYALTCTSDPIFLTMDETVPLAQMLMEFVTNALLYGSAKSSGEIIVSLNEVAGGEMVLDVRIEPPVREVRGGAGRRSDICRTLITSFVTQLGGRAEDCDLTISQLRVRLPYRGGEAKGRPDAQLAAVSP